MADTDGPASTDLETVQLRLDVEKRKAELRRHDLEARKITLALCLYPVVVGTGPVIAIAAVIRVLSGMPVP